MNRIKRIIINFWKYPSRSTQNQFVLIIFVLGALFLYGALYILFFKGGLSFFIRNYNGG
jgi:hypothetical protein